MNLGKYLHGSVGFNNQICRKFMTSKAIDRILYANTTSEVEDKLHAYSMRILERKIPTGMSELVAPLNREILPKNFSCLFSMKFCKNLSEYTFLTGEKCWIKKKLYHSFNYKKKGNSNSYSISFLNNNIEEFGDIQKFIEFEANFYAIVKVYKNLDIVNALPSCPLLFQSFVTPAEIENFYKVVNMEVFDFKLINCDNFLYRCLVIDNGKNTFFSRLVYEFEHD